MRPQSNLRVRKEYKLDKADKTEGFVALWNSRPGTSPYEFVLATVLNIVYPFTKGKIGTLAAKTQKAILKANFNDPGLANSPKAEIRRDLAKKQLTFRHLWFEGTGGIGISSNGIGALIEMLGSEPNPLPINDRIKIVESQALIENTLFSTKRVMTGIEVAALVDLPARSKAVLAKNLDKFEVELGSGASWRIWATWKINQREAEYLNNAPFLQIKISNFYYPLCQWAVSTIGRDTNLPVTIASILETTNDVTNTLAASPIKSRTGWGGMIVDINQHLYILPEENRAAEYEQRLMDVGLKEDGSYSMARVQDAVNTGEAMEIKVGDITQTVKLPSNLPIFTDWLNDRFVYSNTSGRLNVMDLGNTVPVKANHIYKTLHAVMHPDASNTATYRSLAAGMNVAFNMNKSILQIRPEFDELEVDANSQPLVDKIFASISTFSQVIEAAMKLAQHFSDMLEFDQIKKDVYAPKLYQLNSVNGHPSLRFIGRMIDAATEVLEANMEAVYNRISVLSAIQALAVMKAFKAASQEEDVRKEDRQDREVYLSQDIDPDYQVEGLPNIQKNFRYLPHQFKVQNKMRKGPPLAIWGVDAGGGKTPITITNILNELQKERCKRPLIICPSHLVSNYVKEFVYVCQGKMNVIPVTNTSFKVHGEEALFEMIQRAPINTIVLTDMNFLKNRQETVAYGTDAVEVFRNAEFMRQFEFDLVVIDECHYLKNLKSNRRGGSARLIQDIPMKRLCSGTIVADTIKDLVSQVALLDPTIFGSMSNFINEFALEAKGEKIIALRPGAEIEIRKRIHEHCVFATAKRKEWAALLPPSEERFVAVNLTTNQRLLYESILQETTKLIEEAASKNAELQELMESNDDSVADQLEAMLRPYMARLERYLSAPEADPAAELFLKEDIDRISPKVKMIYTICREHIEKGLQGKILIFTQYTASAESVYLNAPPDLQNAMVHYTAGEKMEAKSSYETDPTKKIMVGVSSSMDTGLNFQHVSRLIRMETVWTPGVLEQGNSRINRPQMKAAEERTKIYFDWLIVNQSVDITKVARLISKIVSKAKFDEFDNPAYTELGELTPVPITLEAIASHNDFEESLMPYLEGYQAYDAVKKADYAQYLLDNPKSIEPVPVPTEGLLPDSKLMSRVPYVPEMELYGAVELRLVRYDQFLRQDVSEEEDDGSEDESEDEDDGEDADSTDPRVILRRKQIEARKRERLIVKDRPIHTEFGDGVCTGIGPKRVRVRLSNGRIVRVLKMQAFFITRSSTNAKDMRNELLKAVGKIPLDRPVDVPAEESVEDKRKKRRKNGEEHAPENMPTEANMEAEFDFQLLNDHLGIVYRGDDSDQAIVNVLQGFGFRTSPDYRFTRIRVAPTLIRLFRTWKDMGFVMDKETATIFRDIYESFKSDKLVLKSFGFASKMQLVNFYREQIKPTTNPQQIRVYPMVQDGKLYVMLPTQGHPANKKASRVMFTGMNWQEGGGAGELIKFVSNKVEAKNALKEMQAAGIVITNLDELKIQFNALKMVNR
jgi:SNF2-related domain